MSIISAEDEKRRDKALADIRGAIAAALGPETLWKAAEAVLEVLPDPDETDRLVFTLHRLEAHPDFEYTRTTATAKVFSYKKPDGEGWVLNDAVNGGQSRDELNETWYWRRSIEYLRAQQADEREQARIWVGEVQQGIGLLNRWKNEADELVQRERLEGEHAIGAKGHKLWHRIISNALGHPELPARLGPLFALQLVATLAMAADEVERHPEKRHDTVYLVLHDICVNLATADQEIRSK